MIQWEYKHIVLKSLHIDATLLELGERGWEIIFFEHDADHAIVEMLAKRPIDSSGLDN